MVSYIWRDAATVGAASSANKIAFELATGTDDNGHIHQSEFKIVTALADNEKPNAKLNELQDTQVDSISLTITSRASINISSLSSDCIQLVHRFLDNSAI